MFYFLKLRPPEFRTYAKVVQLLCLSASAPQKRSQANIKPVQRLELSTPHISQKLPEEQYPASSMGFSSDKLASLNFYFSMFSERKMCQKSSLAELLHLSGWANVQSQHLSCQAAAWCLSHALRGFLETLCPHSQEAGHAGTLCKSSCNSLNASSRSQTRGEEPSSAD